MEVIKNHMKIQFYTKNIEVSERVKADIVLHLEKLKKYKTGVKDVLIVQVDISQDAHHKKGDVFRVEVNIAIPKKSIMRVAEVADSIEGAFDVAYKKLERQARDLKDKEVSKRKGN